MKSYTYILIFISLTSILACGQNQKQTKKAYKYDIIVPNLEIPWGFTFLPDNTMLITEKKGQLLHFKNGEKIEISGFPKVYTNEQGGLMDIILHPDYINNGWIYTSFASTEGPQNGGHTAISRFKIKENTVINFQLLYKASPNTRAGQHFGSRLAFDKKNFLYFSIGDRYERDKNPQDITRDGGKIYRLNDDGSIPETNPFFKTRNAKTAIYSYGHRNPQGLALHPNTNAIWSHEHGPKGGDELNIINAGANYGWPKVTFGKNYSGSIISNQTTMDGVTNPIHYWDPSIAPSGMTFVTSDKYPEWHGNILIGSLKFQYLNNCYLDDKTIIKEERLLEGIGRVRSVIQAPDGYIYVGVENLGIVKIVPENQ
ncbi:PQQ-dependent sugar dehydrogenase [Bizionia sp. KMM 8389]